MFRYNTTKSKYNNIPSSAEPIDIGRIDNDHVPLCSINDVQLRFLVPDDLTEVCLHKKPNRFIKNILILFIGKNIMSRLVSHRLSSILV